MFKRVLGWLGIFLGAVGILLSISAVAGTWWLNGVTTMQLLQIFQRAEQALAFGDRTATRFVVFVDNTQTRFNEVEADAPLTTALAAELADEIAEVRRLAAIAEDLLMSIQPITSQFTRAERLNSTLNNTIDALNATDELAQAIQGGRSEAVDALNAELDELQTRAAELQDALAQVTDDLATFKSRVLRGVDLVALGVTLIFVWFGAAQYTLIRSSWRLAQPVPPPSSLTPTTEPL